MSKINELIYNTDTGHSLNYFQREMMESRMKEYAEWYLEQFKESALHHFWINDFCETLISESEFNNIPNPPHE